jgi:FHS family glucose/mannose:H+ symporter-like MFS transporter
VELDARNRRPAAQRADPVSPIPRGHAIAATRVVLSRTAVASIAATLLLLGVVVAAYGPLLEHLTHRFGVSLPVAGATISVHFAGALIGVLVAMRAMEKVSGRLPVMVATGVVGLGCAAVAVAPSWPVFVVAVFVVGMGGGGLVLALNQLVAFSEGRRRAAVLNALNGAYSAGAVAGPILVAGFASEHFSLLYLAFAAVALALIPVASGISGRLPVSTGRPGRPELLVLIFIAAFVLYVGVENGTGGWMTSHLESVGLRSRDAAAYTSGFWLAVVTGRLLMTLVPSRVPEAAIVLAGSAVAAVSLFAASIGAVAPWAYLVTGLAIAPIFPTGIVWLAKLRPGDSRATSWLFPAASLGGIVGPGAIGLVIAGFGVGWAPLVLGVVAVGMLLAFGLAKRSA